MRCAVVTNLRLGIGKNLKAAEPLSGLSMSSSNLGSLSAASNFQFSRGYSKAAQIPKKSPVLMPISSSYRRRHVMCSYFGRALHPNTYMSNFHRWISHLERCRPDRSRCAIALAAGLSILYAGCRSTLPRLKINVGKG